jgi:hypothetical protein
MSVADLPIRLLLRTAALMWLGLLLRLIGLPLTVAALLLTRAMAHVDNQLDLSPAAWRATTTRTAWSHQ